MTIADEIGLLLDAKQARNRCHRVGVQVPVSYIDLSKDEIDERVSRKLRDKS